MHIAKNIYHGYINAFPEMKTISSNSAKTNAKIAIVALSCFTVVIPLAFAVTFGLVNLVGRIQQYKQEKLFQVTKGSADKGNVEAIVELAKLYLRGAGVAKNPEESFNCYVLAAEQRNKEALNYLKKLADEQNHTPALAYLGAMYLYGQGVDKNEDLALKYLEQAADRGVIGAKFTIGERYYEGRGRVKDERKGMDYLKEAARRGNPEAQEYIKQLADAGNMEAQFQMSLLYDIDMKNCQHKKDNQLCFKYTQLAANQGHVLAMCNLGMMYGKGQGVEKNEQLALENLQKARTGKSVVAHYILGEMYYTGKRVEKDAQKGIEYLRFAAEKYNQNAINYLKKNNIPIKPA